MRGRKPEPTVLRMLRGNPGRRPIPAHEPKPKPVENLDPPAWLDPDAREEWDRLAPMLARLGVLTESDVGALSAYCEAWATWKGATQKIREFGMVVKTNKPGELPVVSPYVKIAHNALQHMRGLLIEFGMTPSSRVRVHAAKVDPEEPASKWASLK